MPISKAYSGRLAFDPETGFHLSDDGKKVVTDDEGKTWRYATAKDPSHTERYEKRVLPVDSTANQLAELSLRHGEEQAAAMIEQHHFEVQADDPHFGGLLFLPDAEAATVTSHTEAYA